MKSTYSRVRLLAAAFAPVLLAMGCQSSGEGGGMLKAGLPPSAERVSEGSGQLSFVPEEEGRVFLYDVNEDRVAGRYEMRKGQRLAVDASAGRATVDGNEVLVGQLKGGNSYRIYFLGR